MSGLNDKDGNERYVLEGGKKTIRTGYFSPETFSQRKKRILVLKTGVSGLCYHVDRDTPEGRRLLRSLTPGTELHLFRDPENIHDAWAVSVYTTDGQQLGYISRFKNETVARLMDLGRVFTAFVDEPPEPPADDTERRRTIAPTENYEVPFSVYMEE